MNGPLDTLFYDWVLTEEDRYIPTVMDDVDELSNEAKIDALLSTYSDCVGSLIEAEIVNRMVVDAKIQQVQEDEMLADIDEDTLAQAIEEDDDVMEAQADTDAAKNALNLLHASLVKVLAREV